MVLYQGGFTQWYFPKGFNIKKIENHIQYTAGMLQNKKIMEPSVSSFPSDY